MDIVETWVAHLGNSNWPNIFGCLHIVRGQHSELSHGRNKMREKIKQFPVLLFSVLVSRPSFGNLQCCMCEGVMSNQLKISEKFYFVSKSLKVTVKLRVRLGYTIVEKWWDNLPLHWSVRAAMTKHHRLAGLNNRHLFPHGSGTGSPRSRC